VNNFATTKKISLISIEIFPWFLFQTLNFIIKFDYFQVLHKPPVITEETEVDTDEVEDEVTSNQTTTIIPTPTTALVLKTTTGTRKRPVSSSGGSGGTVDADSSPTPGKRHGGTTPMRTRQRNVSNNMKNNSKSGIGITESSRSSIISSKNKN
jgi:hypothetical protein